MITLPEARQAIRLTLEALDPAPTKDRRAGRFCGCVTCWCVKPSIGKGATNAETFQAPNSSSK